MSAVAITVVAYLGFGYAGLLIFSKDCDICKEWQVRLYTVMLGPLGFLCAGLEHNWGRK